MAEFQPQVQMLQLTNLARGDCFQNDQVLFSSDAFTDEFRLRAVLLPLFTGMLDPKLAAVMARAGGCS